MSSANNLIVRCEQRSEAWYRARLGIPTSSNFHRIYSPTGKKSQQAGDYRLKLLGEWLSGRHHEGYISDDMHRGYMLQAEALKWYQVVREVEIEEVGFIYADETRMAGCSPDALVGEDGMLEIKTPNEIGIAHVRVLLTGEMPSKHIPQVQGQLWAARRKWCDFLSYSEELPPRIVRVHRDDPYIADLARHVGAFVEILLAERQVLLQQGYEPVAPPEPEPEPHPSDCDCDQCEKEAAELVEELMTAPDLSRSG